MRLFCRRPLDACDAPRPRFADPREEEEPLTIVVSWVAVGVAVWN